MANLSFDSQSGTYVGQCADGRSIAVDGDIWAEAVADAIRDGMSREEAEAELLRVSAWENLSAEDRGVEEEEETISSYEPDPDTGVYPAPADELRAEDAEGIARRYFAGLHSLLDRADPEIAIDSVGQIDAPQWPDQPAYTDYDIAIRASIGSWEHEGWNGRRAIATISFAVHRSEGGRLELGGLYKPSEGQICVWSERAQVETRFELRARDVERLAQRVVLELAFRQLQPMVTNRVQFVPENS